MLQKLYSEISSCRKCLEDKYIRDTLSAFEVIDRFIFLPPRIEKGIHKYMLITMEPTDLWFESPEDGRKFVSEGMVGFYHSNNAKNHRGPFILQFVVQTYICNEGETYLITDLGKCSMPPKKSSEEIKNKECPTTLTREKRYINCANYLKQELEIVNPKRIYFVGRNIDGFVKAKKFLREHPWFFNYQEICSYVPHYSGDSRRSGVFKRYCENHIESFNRFKHDNADMQNKIRFFAEKRKNEIIEDAGEKYKNRTYRYIIDALEENGTKPLSDSDWKMIYYYVCEMGKYKS